MKHCGIFYTVYHAGSYILVLIVNVTFYGYRFWSKHGRYIVLDYKVFAKIYRITIRLLETAHLPLP